MCYLLEPGLWFGHIDQQCFVTYGSATIRKITNCATVLYISNYIYISDSIYIYIYIVYCYYLLAFMVYNSPNIHFFIYTIQTIHISRTFHSCHQDFQPRYMPTSDMEKSSARTSCPGNPTHGEKRTRLVFHCHGHYGMDVSNLKAVNILTCDCMCIHIFSKHINNVL